MKEINWNDASALGLIQRINKEILHPLGLAMTRNAKTGTSDSLLVADDGIWHYADDVVMKPILSNQEVQDKIKGLQ